MTRKHQISIAEFDDAVSDAFQNDHGCGAFGNVDILGRRRDVNDILAMAAQPHASPLFEETGRGYSRKFALLVSAAALLVTLATGAGIYNLFLSSPAADAEQQSAASWFGEVQNPGPALFLGQTLASASAPVPVDEMIRVEEGDAMLRLPTGIDWHMKEHAGGKIQPVTAEHLKIALSSGENWFRVNPERKGPAFSVETPLGQIQVTGTIFVVDVQPKDVRVSLLKGEVWITLPSGQRSRLRMGHTMQLNAQTQSPLPASTMAQYQQQLTELDWVDRKTELAATRSSSQAYEPTNESLRADAISSEKHSIAVPMMTQTQLLRTIRRERQQQNWGKVAELYRRLINMSPGSETSTVSRVSLAEVYLSKLHRYDDALTLFNRYLQSGHTALLPEATFGKCNALKHLGKSTQETQCLENFVARYPYAFQTLDARTRLNTINQHDRR